MSYQRLVDSNNRIILIVAFIALLLTACSKEISVSGSAASCNDQGNNIDACDPVGDINLYPVNQAPTTTDVTLPSIFANSGVRGITQADLLANASDVDGDALKAIGLVIRSGTGTLVASGDNTWNYAPAGNDATSVSFSYIVTDGAIPVAGTANLDIIAALLEPDVDVVITPEDVSTESLQDIVNSYGENTRFLIKAGTYRMQTISPKKGMVFYGDVDTSGNRYTILNGSRLLTDFQQADGLYYVTGQTQRGETNGETETGWGGSRHPEDLFFDDIALKQVLKKSDVTTNTWYFDYDNDTIWFANDPAGHKVETSVTPYAFHQTYNMSTAPQVTIKGFIVEKYANKAQKGAIGGEGVNEQWYVAYNETRLNHATGIFIGANSFVMYNYSHHNGEMGMKTGADGCVFQGNEMSYNNTQHFSVGWGGGGAKHSSIDGLVFKDNYSHHNYGRGLWIDIGSHNVTIDNNLITHNHNGGIFYEISDTGTISNNKLAHNGQSSEWLFGGGVVMSSSSDIDVFGNSVIVNADYGNGITFFWTDRHLDYAHVGHTPPLRVENIHIHNNDVTYLGVLNIQNNMTPVSGAIAASGVDEWSASGTIDGVPSDAYVVVSDITIIDPRLNNQMTSNTYHVPDLSQKWFIWGPSASRISWDDFRNAGNDIDGSIDDIVVDGSATWTWDPAVNLDLLTTEVVW